MRVSGDSGGTDFVFTEAVRGACDRGVDEESIRVWRTALVGHWSSGRHFGRGG